MSNPYLIPADPDDELVTTAVGARLLSVSRKTFIALADQNPDDLPVVRLKTITGGEGWRKYSRKSVLVFRTKWEAQIDGTTSAEA